MRRLLSTSGGGVLKRNSQLWGFQSQPEIAQLLSEQRIIVQFMDQLQKQNAVDTAKEFNLDMDKLDVGLKLAYSRIAQVFEQAVPGEFELKNSDLVAPQLARQLDYQLELFQKQKKLPRLYLSPKDIQVKLVGMWVFPKYTREVIKSRELVLGVEYTVKERFELVDSEVVSLGNKYADEFIGDGKEEDPVANNADPISNKPLTEEEENAVEPQKHYWVFVAQVDDDANPAEQDLDFVLTSMNEPFDFLLGM
ncbi:hypothetical protein BASA81_012591 [Batrachochytrium salamandrivorans]|nr:hypothetical protein BASA81_012591 [Batrachochytrium salamandrivorans]